MSALASSLSVGGGSASALVVASITRTTSRWAMRIANNVAQAGDAALWRMQSDVQMSCSRRSLSSIAEPEPAALSDFLAGFLSGFAVGVTARDVAGLVLRTGLSAGCVAIGGTAA